MVRCVIYNPCMLVRSIFTKLGFMASRYKEVKIPKTKKIIKLKIKNFFSIELELKKLDLIN